MTRHLTLWAVSILLLGGAGACWAKPAEVTDPAEAAKDPDFAIQGEYFGEVDGQKAGAQVIARGEGKFDIVGYAGGLPGDGWKRGDKQHFATAKRQGDTVVVTEKKANKEVGKIANETLTLNYDGREGKLKKIARKSPTLGEKAPAGAVVLFDGSSADKWDNPSHFTKDKCLESGVTSKDGFGSYKLHLEFRLSWMPEAAGQARSNSGVYIHDCYECQVLDSFGLEGKNNECGGFYQVREPDVNMCLPPLCWQTYDIDFTAPKYEGDKKVANARITIVHNGVTIHKDVELPNGTPGRKAEGPAPRQIHLQGHGNHVYYQNIWLVPKQ